MSSVLLEMKNIEFNYDVSDEWTLMVDKLCFMSGEITGIVGPNGSGKSTLLRIAAGVISADTGDVLLQDNNIAGMSRKCIAGIMGYLPQESTSLYDYTVAEVVRMGRYAHQSGFAGYTEEDIEAVNSALATTGLDRYRRKMLSCLSGGERRRALIASVLAQQPELMLLDEPTGGLDIHHASAIFRLLSSLSRADGPGVVVVTHNINLASLFCDRLIVLENGKIIADGKPDEIITEDIMCALYGNEILVTNHPQIKRPMVLPAAEQIDNK